MQFTRDELMSVFRALGADDPEGWTASQLEEGIPQLHRFMFLAKAWSEIPDERDYSWIEPRLRPPRRIPTPRFRAAATTGLATRSYRFAPHSAFTEPVFLRS